VDFVAYYPFSATINDVNFTLAIDVSDQTAPRNLDVLWSNNATGYNNANHDVRLFFGRRMSQLVVNVSAGTGITSLTNLTIEVEGVFLQGSMNLTNGVVSAYRYY